MIQGETKLEWRPLKNPGRRRERQWINKRKRENGRTSPLHSIQSGVERPKRKSEVGKKKTKKDDPGDEAQARAQKRGFSAQWSITASLSFFGLFELLILGLWSLWSARVMCRMRIVALTTSSAACPNPKGGFRHIFGRPCCGRLPGVCGRDWLLGCALD
jgi:hypothetical protein